MISVYGCGCGLSELSHIIHSLMQEVSISQPFPFLTNVIHHRYEEVEILLFNYIAFIIDECIEKTLFDLEAQQVEL